jgi:hypothetical protein
MELLCPKHEQEGDIPAYFDEDGNELDQNLDEIFGADDE